MVLNLNIRLGGKGQCNIQILGVNELGWCLSLTIGILLLKYSKTRLAGSSSLAG